MAGPMNPVLPTLKRQLWVWFLWVSLLPMILLALGFQWQLERELIQEKQLQLYTMAREKGRLVNETVYSVKVQLKQLSSLPSLGFLLQNSHNTAALNIVTQYTNRFIDMTGHHDVLLINQQGIIIYSNAHESDLHADLTSATWQDSPITQAFDQVRSLMTTIVTPYRFYEPSQKRASFMATPVWGAEGEWLGVVVIQLNPDWLAHISASQIGLSQTGEVVLAQHNSEGKLVAAIPLRLDSDAQAMQIYLDGNHEIPANHAIRGNEGWGRGTDYRYQSVIAGWVYIPALQMALVVKQDEAEVLDSLTQVRLLSLSLLLLVVILVSFVSLFVSRRLSQPLVAIIDTLQQLKSGRWHIRVATRQIDSAESAHLVAGINQLADTIEDQLEQLQQQTTELEYQAQTLEQFNHDLEETVAERTKELAQLSLIDPMTGLFNRRHYAEAGASLWKRVVEQRQCLLFVLLDVDHFKLYNDSRGHQMGDKALTLVADCLQQACRNTDDMAFRMGGEEMALLMTIEHQQDALIIAEDLRRSVEAKAIIHPSSPIKDILTVSMGVAMMDSRCCSSVCEANLDGLYRLADEALYRAKHQGRNQVVVATEVLGC